MLKTQQDKADDVKRFSKSVIINFRPFFIITILFLSVKVFEFFLKQAL
ncbi:hypothetical protein HMPREF1112_1881 [Streptococcus pseudopneumoniae SK674]|nr:hypothetical protein HMPREF1046_1730 [Streptococcus pseudopneumoniae ATCC BAA-960 = CCUG 49455]EID69562.1 hypothetical protein HMPREF1112_1881 [Streptococcus pseudopneumoniae SK674]